MANDEAEEGSQWKKNLKILVNVDLSVNEELTHVA